MAIFHLSLKPGSRSKNRSGQKKIAYIFREQQYEKNPDKCVAKIAANMPGFTDGDPRKFFKLADKFERKNARIFLEFEGALPVELTLDQQIELTKKFIEKIAGGRLPAAAGIHAGRGSNPHFHLMISERMNDGIERPGTQFFKRFNSKNPAGGGAKKTRAYHDKKSVVKARKIFEILTNEALAEAGFSARVTADSKLKSSGNEAAKISQQLNEKLHDADSDFSIPLAPVFEFFDDEIEKKKKAKKIAAAHAEELKKKLAAERKKRHARLAAEQRMRSDLERAARRLKSAYSPAPEDSLNLANTLNAAYSKPAPRQRFDDEQGVDFE